MVCRIVRPWKGITSLSTCDSLPADELYRHTDPTDGPETVRFLCATWLRQQHEIDKKGDSMREQDSTCKLFMILIILVIMGWHVLGEEKPRQDDPPISKKTEDAETEEQKNRRERFREKTTKISPDDPPWVKVLKNANRRGRLNEKERILDRYSKPGQYEDAYNSREVKGNEDFLLTPALLVQEALAEDIVPTYPRE